MKLDLIRTVTSILIPLAALAYPDVSALAADIPGAKDPAGIMRYEGTEIVRFEQIKFDRFVLPLGKMTKFDFSTKQAEFERSEPYEGAVTRATYHLADPTRSSLEIYRNYEKALTESGWEIAWRASGKPEFGNSFPHLYENIKDNDQLFTYSEAAGHVLAAKKPAQGLAALLFVTKFQDGLRRGLKIEKGDPIIQLDLVQTKQMEQKMVVVPAAEMQKAFSQRGGVALYGILFDFNKAEIKSESEEAIAEIAKLLKGSPELRVVVTGHTDSIGEFSVNQELSQRRASAVVATLSSKYGINPARMIPFGASSSAPIATNQTEEGRTKNRRVEVVEIVSARQ